MADVKAYTIGNYFYLEFTGNNLLISDKTDDVEVRLIDSSTSLYRILSDGLGRHEILLADLVDKDSTRYTLGTWETFFQSKTASEPPEDFHIQVARSLIDGTTQFPKLGYNLDLDTADNFQVIWPQGSDWVPMASAETLDLVSESGDDNPAGVGAREVTIIGIDANGDEQTVAIATNGLSTVTTTETWMAVNDVVVTDVGGQEHNVGAISVSGSVSGDVQGFMLLETSMSHQLFFTVPNGKSAYIEMILLRVAKTSGGGSPKVDIRLFKRENGVKIEVQRALIDADFDTQINQTLLNPGIVQENDYWWVEAKTDTNNTFIRGSIEQKVIDN